PVRIAVFMSGSKTVLGDRAPKKAQRQLLPCLRPSHTILKSRKVFSAHSLSAFLPFCRSSSAMLKLYLQNPFKIACVITTRPPGSRYMRTAPPPFPLPREFADAPAFRCRCAETENVVSSRPAFRGILRQ